jgi:nicotinamidase-related amidase
VTSGATSGSRPDGLVHGPIGPGWRHLCVDMQQLFSQGSAWTVPWMDRIIPAITELTSRDPARTIFTRFIPATTPVSAFGAWRRYYERWADMTLSRLDPHRVEIVPQLARFAPPAEVLDKRVYSPWADGRLDHLLQTSPVDTLIITGGETDICVLAAVLGAVDRGYRVILVADALCGSVDQTHEALLGLYRTRFSEQIETARLDEVLSGSL